MTRSFANSDLVWVSVTRNHERKYHTDEECMNIGLRGYRAVRSDLDQHGFGECSFCKSASWKAA